MNTSGSIEKGYPQRTRRQQNKEQIVFMYNKLLKSNVVRETTGEELGWWEPSSNSENTCRNNWNHEILALMKGNDAIFYRTDNLVACTWHDTKRVTFLSTVDTDNTVDDKQIRCVEVSEGIVLSKAWQHWTVQWQYGRSGPRWRLYIHVVRIIEFCFLCKS